MKKIPKIAILGGGIGGLVCASELNHRVGPKAEITIFDKSPYHLYQPALLHLALGERKLEAIRRPLEKLKKQGINFLNGEVYRIDPDEMLINAEHGDFIFDYIIFALGAQQNPSATEGFEEYALNLYTTEGTTQIYEKLKDFEEGKISILINSMPFKCPVAPYEMAFLLDSYMRRKKKRKDVEITIATVEPHPMPIAGEAIGAKITEMLKMAEIEYLPKEKIKSIGKQISLSKKRFKSDLTIGIPEHICPDVALDAGMVKKGEWIEVDRHNMETMYENIYALGDSVGIKLDNGKFLPKAGVFAKSQGEVLAQNIAHKIMGSKNEVAKFDGKGGCFLETSSKKAAFAKGDFYHKGEPQIRMKNPSLTNYYYKKLLEKYWLKAWI